MNASLALALTATRPAQVCRVCSRVLDGGPAVFWCPSGHGIFHASSAPAAKGGPR